MRRRGFTLVEVVVALLVLEIGVLGALATLVHASEISRRAETLERAVTRVEAVLDSLGAGGAPDTVVANFDGYSLRWTMDGAGRVEIRAVDGSGVELVRASSAVPVVAFTPPSSVPPAP